MSAILSKERDTSLCVATVDSVPKNQLVYNLIFGFNTAIIMTIH